MSSKLSDLINNLYDIYSKKCRGCKEIKKIKSVCDFIGLKLHHKCNECKKRWLAPISALIKKFLSTYKCCNNINKFLFLVKIGVYPMNIWIVRKDLTKHHE